MTEKDIINRNVDAFVALQQLSLEANLPNGTESQKKVAALICALVVGDDAEIRQLSQQAVLPTRKNTLEVADVRAALKELRIAAVQDYEAAHGMEDDLRAKVLNAIAKGAPNAMELARAVLNSKKIDFCRYCG